MSQKKGLLFFLTTSVILAWGIVPALATVGDLPAGITTFIVNFFSALSLAVMISFGIFDRFDSKNISKSKEDWQRKWKVFENYNFKTYISMSILCFFWPFLYSLAYFHSIYLKQASLVVLLNFTWPLFCVMGLYLIYNKKFKLVPFLGILISVLAAVFYVFTGNAPGGIVYLMLGLGGIVAITQGGYAAITDGGWWKDVNPGVLTFVGACVTIIMSFFYSLFFGELSQINQTNLLSVVSLAVIGIFSNGLGFSAFLIANQMTAGEGERKLKTKAVWLVSLSLIPFAQLLFLLMPFDVLRKKVVVSSANWMAVGLLMIAFVILKLSSWYEEWKKRELNK